MKTTDSMPLSLLIKNSFSQSRKKICFLKMIPYLKKLNQVSCIKHLFKYCLILCIPFLTICQLSKKELYPSDFRISISVQYAEKMFSEGYYYEDDKTTARTIEELQKMFINHGSTELFAQFNTIRERRPLNMESHSYAVEIAKLAKKLNLPFNPQIWVCPNYSDISGQEPPDFSDFPELNVPGEWTDLNLDQMQSILYDYGILCAKDILNTGVTVNIWDLGIETDYGFAGVAIKWGQWFEYKAPDAIDPEIGKMNITDFFQMPQQERISWLQQHIWKYTSKLFKALADGIKSVDPDARFSTHIASSTNPELAVAYFKAMNDGGYYPDELGLSFYPTSGKKEQDKLTDFKNTVTLLNRELGKKVYIGEFAYPAGEMTGYYKWNAEIEGYPLTDEGQAFFIQDLVAWGYSNGMLSGIRPWGFDLLDADWLPMSFFNVQDKRAIARPSLGSIQMGLRQAKKQ